MNQKIPGIKKETKNCHYKSFSSTFLIPFKLVSIQCFSHSWKKFPVVVFCHRVQSLLRLFLDFFHGGKYSPFQSQFELRRAVDIRYLALNPITKPYSRAIDGFWKFLVPPHGNTDKYELKNDLLSTYLCHNL